MPIPYVLIGIAAVTGAIGAGTNIHANIRGSKAKKIIKKAEDLYDEATNRLEVQRKITLGDLECFGNLKLKIWSEEFENYINHFKRFKKVELTGSVNVNGRLNTQIKKINIREIARVSITADKIIKGGVAIIGSGALAGIATYGAAMLFGHASTGIAIRKLKGAAAKKAALAFLGGGAKAAGGLGMAGGAAMMAGVVIGPLFAVQGLIANARAKEILSKAKEAYSEAVLASEKMDTVIAMLKKVSDISGDYSQFLTEFLVEYRNVILKLMDIYNKAVDEQKKTFWNAVKNFFGIKFKLDFTKLSTTDQKYIQYSWLMTQILYQVLTESLMTDDGNIQINAERSLEEAKTTMFALVSCA